MTRFKWMKSCLLVWMERSLVYSIDKALDAAKKLAIDLVQVFPPDSEPVVCKLLDYGKFFGKKKSSSNSKSNLRKIQLKKLNLDHLLILVTII